MTLDIWVTSIFILMMLSFVVKENVFYRIGEFTLIGGSGGMALLGAYKIITGNAIKQVTSGSYIYIIAIILGAATFLRFSKDQSWVSRYPVSILIGLGVGILIPTLTESDVLEQIRDTINPLTLNEPMHAFNSLVTMVIVLAVVWFFVFTREPKYPIESHIRRFARAIIMASFGVGIGATVMEYAARTITALQVLLSEWLQIAVAEVLKYFL
jgi:hypothetical protein